MIYKEIPYSLDFRVPLERGRENICYFKDERIEAERRRHMLRVTQLLSDGARTLLAFYVV